MSHNVQLEELIFTQSWEDPALDRQVFGKGKRVATVASGGCNALTFLLDDPECVEAFDYNQTQVWLCELKIAAFEALSHDELLEFFGLRPSPKRRSYFDALSLRAPVRDYFSKQAWLFDRGLLGGGRYERFVRMFSRAVRLMQGGRKIDALLADKTLDAQAHFFDTEWDTRAWRAMFGVFFNRHVLARRGLSADYFRFADGTGSFAESFARRTRHALTSLSVHQNYFVAQYLLGRYLSETQVPDYLRAEHFDTIRSRLHRVKLRQLDVRQFASAYRDQKFDAICLSNVFELMPDDQTQRALSDVRACMDGGAQLTLRNLMIPRQAGAATGLARSESVSQSLLLQDRSFVYRAFDVYEAIQ